MGADHDDNNTPDNTSATSSTPGRGDALARRLKQIERDEVEAETMEERLGREGAAGLGAVVREWVWVSMLGIYMNRADPSIALKKETFNDKFRCYAPKGCSVSNLLHSRRKDTILKPDRVVYRPNRGEFLKAGRE